MSIFGICKMCGEEKKLVRAHIIPESAYKPMKKDPKKSPLLKSDRYDGLSKRCPTGVYDRTILCENCEKSFEVFDDYGCKVLFEKRYTVLQRVEQDGNCTGIIVGGIDYSKLKLFFLSVLWRASVSSHDFYSKIDCGPFESDLLDMIKNNNPGSRHDFPIVVAEFDHHLATSVMMDPKRTYIDRINFYQIYLFGYVIYIKVDRQDVPASLINLIFLENGQMPVVFRSFRDSKELKVLAKLL